MAQQYKWVRYEGQTENAGKDHLTKASTAITQGRPLTIDSNGYVVHATDATTTKIIGVAMESKASSDTSTAPILIDYIKRGDIWRVTVDTGTLIQSYIGDSVDVGAAGGLDITTTTHGDVYLFNLVGGGVTSEVLVKVLNAC